MPITSEVLDQLLKDYEKPEDLLSENGLLQQLTKALVERALNGELTHHLGYEKHDPAGNNSGNSRNGTTPKVIKGKRGQIEIEVPRDRNGEFEPQLIKKNQKRFDGLDEKIISLYARGMTTSEIKGHLEEIYRARYFAELDLDRDRFGFGRSSRLAIAPARSRLSDSLPGRSESEGQKSGQSRQ